MSKSEQIARLRRNIADVRTDDPVAAFYDQPVTEAVSPQLYRQPQPVPAGGYPVDYFWEQEALELQSISGEDPQ